MLTKDICRIGRGPKSLLEYLAGSPAMSFNVSCDAKLNHARAQRGHQLSIRAYFGQRAPHPLCRLAIGSPMTG
jgi:hypothetical protein